MSLLAKTDYFGIAGTGIEVQSTNENRSKQTAEAVGPNGFTVAIEAFGERIEPECEYLITQPISSKSIVIGGVHTVDSKQIALGNLTISTSAGSAPTMTASGSQIEDGGTAKCKVTVSLPAMSSLFHAQDFGLFTVLSGQLNDSTLTIEGDVGTAEVDGVIKASDLTNGRMTVTGTIIGVSDAGAISTPSLSVATSGTFYKNGVITQPLSLTNPNGDFPSYSFTCQWALIEDGE